MSLEAFATIESALAIDPLDSVNPLISHADVDISMLVRGPANDLSVLFATYTMRSEGTETIPTQGTITVFDSAARWSKLQSREHFVLVCNAREKHEILPMYYVPQLRDISHDIKAMSPMVHTSLQDAVRIKRDCINHNMCLLHDSLEVIRMCHVHNKRADVKCCIAQFIDERFEFLLGADCKAKSERCALGVCCKVSCNETPGITYPYSAASCMMAHF